MDRPQPFGHGLFADPPASLAEDLDCRQSDGGIGGLVFA